MAKDRRVAFGEKTKLFQLKRVEFTRFSSSVLSIDMFIVIGPFLSRLLSFRCHHGPARICFLIKKVTFHMLN